MTLQMKVVVLPSWYPPDGGVFFEYQARELRRRGLDVSVIAPKLVTVRHINDWLGAFPARCELHNEDGLVVYRVRIATIPKVVRTPLWIARAANIGLMEYTRHHGLPDLIHAHSAMWAGYAAARIFKRLGVPYVLTEHRGRFSVPGFGVERWMSCYLANAYGNARKVLLVGSLLRRGISQFWADVNKAELLSNGVHTDQFVLETPKGPGFRFAFVGALEQGKGLDVLIGALPEVIHAVPQLRIDVVGDGPLGSWARAEIRRLGLDRYVKFHGLLPHDQVANIMRMSHAFVLPTRLEAQGVVYLEAMSCGLPIIATDASPPEICPEPVGIRIPAGNVRSLIDAMISMVTDYEKYDAARIREFAIQHFDFQVVTRRLIEIYEAILSKSR